MNTISKITFDFKTDNEEFTRSLYERWDNFFDLNVEKIIDNVLGKYDRKGLVIEIDCLELDLEQIEEDSFDEHFPLLLREKLEEALLPYLNNIDNDQLTEKDYLFNILCRFLLHGYLPWNVANKYKNICELFLSVLKDNSKRLKSFLLTYGHYTVLQERLVYQLDEPLLEKGIYLLAPSESTFICSYIHFLKEKYNTQDKAYIQQSNYRNAVFLVVYSYLLTNRSSFFNKKSFLISTINQLAKKYNLTYDYLLTLLTMQLDSLAAKQSIHAELYLILKQLKSELSERLLKESFNDYEKLYYQISSGIKENTANVLIDNELQTLFIILSNESTCRRFFQPLKELEIISLVQIILPNESPFVITYAKTLDTQQEKGFLEGKAGSEFRLLKWQIIFPLLIENEGIAFNRKYFVRDTLKKIAAHYNLTVDEVLKYICSIPLNISGELLAVFNGLRSEYNNNKKEGTASHQNILSVSEIRHLIKNNDSISIHDIKSIIKLLSDDDLRSKLLKSFSEKEYAQLISLLIPSESYFILPYAHILDTQRKNIEVKSIAQSDFSKIKWTFIYAVLFVSTNQVFNKKYFVEKTLSKVASHYNTNVKDLLILFYQNNVLENVRLPFDLIQVFEELKKDYKLTSQKDQPITETTDEKLQENAKKTLEKYFGKEANFTDTILQLSEQPDFINFIDEILGIESLLYRFICSELNITINRKKILNLLLKLSAEYRYLSREDILSRIVDLITQDIDVSKQTLFYEKINSLFQTNKLLKNYSNIINHKNDIIMEKQNMNIPQEEPMYVDNAGIVLLSPYLPRLFSMMSLTESNNFKGEQEQLKALAVTYYLVTGKDKSPNEQYIINKLFVGMNISKPIPQLPELTKEEKETCESLLKAVLQNWGKLRNTSIMTLREAFLMRSSKVEIKEDSIHLTVEEKAYDMLLDSVPWNFRMIKFPWMEKRIEVRWR